MWSSQAIIFDLDDTLYSESHHFEHIFSDFCSINKWPKSSYLPIINDFTYIRRYQKDIFSYFLKHNLEYWETNNKNNSLRRFNNLRNMLFLLYNNIEVNLTPMKGASRWIEYAFRNSMKVGVLTNGVIGAQNNKWKNLNLPYKDDITFVAARECKREKPFYEPFLHISNSIGVKFSKITFIGDHFENDLEYPLSIGSTGILINEHSNRSGNSMIHIAKDLHSSFLFFKEMNS
jgi:FMN phosphatase YigB (HAD superfamily)